MSTDLAPAAPTTRPDLPPLLPAARLAFALLVLSQLALVVFAWWKPPFDGSTSYDDVAGPGAAYWPMHVLLGGPAFALTAVTTTVFLLVLGTGRGRALTLVGATAQLLGGLVFALVVTAEVLPLAFAVQAPEATGRAQVEALAEPLAGYGPYVLVPMLVVALGALLAITGAALSGGLPWWVLGVAVVVAALVFALPPDGALVPAVDLAQRALWVYVGWRGLRVASGRA